MKYNKIHRCRLCYSNKLKPLIDFGSICLSSAFPYKNLKYKKHPNSEKIADDVMENGILIGCHQGLKINDLIYIFSKFKKFAKVKKL